MNEQQNPQAEAGRRSLQPDCCAALERAITALTYRADTLEESIAQRPGAAIASIMAEGVKNDRKAIATLTDMLRHNNAICKPHAIEPQKE